MGVLSGKAVVITGSGGGIGAACAIGAARQGASVVVNGINPTNVSATVDTIRAEGGKAVACLADVADWNDAERLIHSCIEAFGKIDGLVNNAGVLYKGRLEHLDPQSARALIDVNLMGTLFCAAHAIKPMLAQGSGSIVNVTSLAQLGMPDVAVYAASKGAVASMVYCWAIDLAGTGVRVNAISPLAGGTKMVPADPLTQPPEANSPVVEYLLSDLSSHVNGQLVLVHKEQLYLHTHPAMLLPPALCSQWSAEMVAEAFRNEFKDRQVACGILGMECLPVPL